MSWWRWTCSERGACSFNLPRPSSLWAEETLFLSVYTFSWGLFSSPTIFAAIATSQQPACSWFPFSAEQYTFFSFLSSWIYLWLAETSEQPISQTTWLKVTPIVTIVTIAPICIPWSCCLNITNDVSFLWPTGQKELQLPDSRCLVYLELLVYTNIHALGLRQPANWFKLIRYELYTPDAQRWATEISSVFVAV